MTKQAQTRLVSLLPKQDTAAPYSSRNAPFHRVNFDWSVIEDCPLALASELFHELNRLVDYSKLIVQSSTEVARRGNGHDPNAEN